MTNQIPDPDIVHRLEELKEISPRNPQQAALGRANFLSEAVNYQKAVSPGTKVRQTRQTFLTYRKENFAMNALISLFLATALILGGGATAVAAQDDLPNQPLYPVKLWTENATLALAGDPQEQANLLMNMAQTRVEEMTALAGEGTPIPAQVGERLQQQIQQTLMLATQMDDAALNQTLLQLRERLQIQERLMEQLQTNATAETDPVLTQTRLMLQTRLRLVEEGLADPQGFRYTMSNQMQYGQNEDVTPEPNQQGEPGFHQNDQGGQPPVEPGNGNGMQNPGNGQNGNDDNGSGKETDGGQNSDNGGCSGANCGGENSGGGDNGGNSGGGSCTGCGGGNGGGGNK